MRNYKRSLNLDREQYKAILKTKHNVIREPFVKGSSRGAMMATLGKTFGLDHVTPVAVVNDARHRAANPQNPGHDKARRPRFDKPLALQVEELTLLSLRPLRLRGKINLLALRLRTGASFDVGTIVTDSHGNVRDISNLRQLPMRRSLCPRDRVSFHRLVPAHRRTKHSRPFPGDIQNDLRTGFFRIEQISD